MDPSAPAPSFIRYRRCMYTFAVHLAISTGSFTRNHLVRPVAYACDAEPLERGHGAAYCLDHMIALGLCTHGDFCIDPVAPGATLCARHSAPPSVCASCPPASATVTIYIDCDEVRFIDGSLKRACGSQFLTSVLPQKATPAKKTSPERPEATPPAPKKARSNVAKISAQPPSAPTAEERAAWIVAPGEMLTQYRDHVAEVEFERQQQVKAASARLRARLLEPEMPSDDDLKVEGVLSVTCN